MLFATPSRGRCERAYESVVSIARREAHFGYAHEVSKEGRRAFFASCPYLSARELRCIARARSSDQLYACTP